MNKRSPLFVLVLTIITLGIYEIYWLYITRKELNAKLQGRVNSWPVSILFAPIAVIILLALGYALMSQTAAPESPLGNSLYYLIGALSVIAIMVVPFIWFYKFTKLVSAATPQSSNNLYLIWFLLTIFSVGFIWPTLVQSHINSADSNALPPQQDPVVPPQTPITPQTPPVPPASPSTYVDTTNR